MPRDPLTSTRSPGLTRCERQLRSVLSGRDMMHALDRHPGSDRRVGQRPRGTAADGDQDRQAGVRGGRAALSVQPLSVRAELEHLAEHGDLARAPFGGGDQFERALQRRGARVVRIVDERDAAGQPQQLAAVAGGCQT